MRELLTSFFVLATLPLFFLLPGYGLVRCTGLMGTREASLTERLLWGTVVSVPISLLISVHPSVPLPSWIATLMLLVLDAFALSLLLRDLRDSMRRKKGSLLAGVSLAGVSAAVGVPLYVIFCTVPVVWKGRLYESAVWQDWSIRIQLVNAAIRGGTPPGNPMFAVQGHAATLRYYYFWYVLCARMHDVVPVGSRAIFAVGCAGAGLALLAFLLLSVKYLLDVTGPVRRTAAAALLAGCIMGLDLLAATAALLHGRFYSDVQFWLDDRCPSWLNMILGSPHHVAGFVCCGLGTLLLVYARDISRAQQWLHALLAGICFAVAVGTSSFLTLLFGFGCLLITVDALLRRQWSVVRSAVLATVVAVPLAMPFLYGFFHTKAGAPGPQTQSHLVSLKIRYNNQASSLLWHELLAKDKTLTASPLPGGLEEDARARKASRLFRTPLMAVLFVCDFGFFLFVFWWQCRRDVFSRGTMTRRARVLWLLFCAFAVPGFFLSSAGLQANNDLGRHAGFGMRWILTLWAAPYIVRFWDRRKAPHKDVTSSGQPPRVPAFSWTVPTTIAFAFAVIGLAGQACQVFLTRARFALTNANLLPRPVIEERVSRPAYRFEQLQSAMKAASRATPKLGIVQGNPHSLLHNVLVLYTDRQMVAADDGCNTPFGGDPRDCAPEARALVELFGGMGRHYQGESTVFEDRIPYLAASVTPENFEQVCSRLKLDTVVASYVDPVWWHRESWVWQLHPFFANATARVFACGPSSAVGAPSEAVPQRPPSPYTGF